MSYSGKYQYLDERGTPAGQGPGQVSFDAESCTVTPASGAPIAFDLGDIDRAAAGELDLQLTLYTGRTIQLRQFGGLFNRMSGELLAAWRDRTVRCLMLEDLGEVGRFSGMAALGATAGAPAEIRLYESNLAVLPMSRPPVQWRLAEIDSVTFDDDEYRTTLRSGGERLVFSRLGNKTEQFLEKLNGAIDALRTHSANALHGLFPFLGPEPLAKLVTAMPEGRSVRLAALAAIHPKLPGALTERAVDEPLRPYFDALRGRAAGDSLLAGFKFSRSEEEAEDAEETPLFFWFFFPLSGNVLAWEATTGSGRATYFFRVAGDVDEAVARLTRGLALVNFRREPVYLPDDALEQDPRYRRYAIGCRKLPDLRALRAAFSGRAIHLTPEAWAAQVQAIPLS